MKEEWNKKIFLVWEGKKVNYEDMTEEEKKQYCMEKNIENTEIVLCQRGWKKKKIILTKKKLE